MSDESKPLVVQAVVIFPWSAGSLRRRTVYVWLIPASCDEQNALDIIGPK